MAEQDLQAIGTPGQPAPHPGQNRPKLSAIGGIRLLSVQAIAGEFGETEREVAEWLSGLGVVVWRGRVNLWELEKALWKETGGNPSELERARATYGLLSRKELAERLRRSVCGSR